MATRTRLTENELPQAAREMLRRVRRHGWTVQSLRKDQDGHPCAKLTMRGAAPATITWDENGKATHLLTAARDLLN